MKKQIFAIALGAILISSVNSQAQEIRSVTEAEATTVEAPVFKGRKLNSASEGARMVSARPVEAMRPDVFEQLNLTPDQKSKIAALNEEARTACKKSPVERDSVRNACRNAACNARAEYLGKLKNILNHEQYIQFLEYNYTTMPQRHAVGPRGEGFRKFDKAKGPKARKADKARKGDKAKKADRRDKKDKKD